MHDIGFLPITDIFLIILADTDTDIFPFCLETTPSLSSAEIISTVFLNFGSFLTITYLLELNKPQLMIFDSTLKL